MEVKGKQLARVAVVVIVALIIGLGGHIWLKRTAPMREFKKQLEAAKLVHERNQLEIEMYEQQKRMDEIKAEQEADVPAYELTPKESKKGKKRKK